jgi:hypothetical protein
LALATPLSSGLSVKAQQASQQASSQIAIVFPADAQFADLQSKLQDKTKLSGSAWVDEFKKHQILGQVLSSNGLPGTLFTDAAGAINVVNNQVPFVVYGTISIPKGSKLGQKDFSGDYGIVVMSGPLAIALIDLKTGDIRAFLVIPPEDQSLLLASFFFPPFSPLAIFQIVSALITVPPPATQPPLSQPPTQTPSQKPVTMSCSQDLSNKSDLNVQITAATPLVSFKDSSGKALYEIDAAPPGTLTVQSFDTSVQYTYTIIGQVRIGIIIGPGKQTVPLTIDTAFLLNITNGTKSACIQATPQITNGILTIVGTLRTN